MRKKLFTNHSKKIWKPCKSAKIVTKPCTIPKVATRLWARLTFVCGEHLHALVGNTCMCLWGTLACACENDQVRTTHHVPFSIFHFRTTLVSSKFILYKYNIKIYIHIHDSLLRTMKKQKWCVVRGALVCQIVKFCLAKEIMNVNLPLSWIWFVCRCYRLIVCVWQ